MRISDPAGCGRFTGRVIRNVNARAATPDWMRQRLERAGQRCISALVDVTNYVMLELGRPLHVYDLAKLADGIDVRFGREGERLKLLNEQTVELDADVLAITDASGPIGLAGIMGGDSTKADLRHARRVSGSRVLLSGRHRRPRAPLQLRERCLASLRARRGFRQQRRRASSARPQLILEICGGEPGPVVDTVARLPERQPVRMRVARARTHHRRARSTPTRWPTSSRGSVCGREREGQGPADVFVVTPPSYRFDLADRGGLDRGGRSGLRVRAHSR